MMTMDFFDEDVEIELPPEDDSSDPHVRVVGTPENVSLASVMVRQQLEPHNKITMKMDVSWTHHSHIIGKAGNTIQPVVRRTGVSIHFPDGNKNNEVRKSNQVSINSRGEELGGLEEARASIRQLTPLIFTFSLNANAEYISIADPHLLVQHVQGLYNVQVELSVTGGVDPMLVGSVRGSETDVTRVKEATLTLLQNLCGNIANHLTVQMKMEVSPQHHSFILGRNNDTLKKIMSTTATDIRFPDSNDPSLAHLQKSTVTISGAIENVYAARQNIVGALPLVLMFEVGDNGASVEQIAQVMQTLSLSIIPKPVRPDGRRPVIIKAAERDAGHIYEAWKLVTGSDKKLPSVMTPPSYHIAQSSAASLSVGGLPQLWGAGPGAPHPRTSSTSLSPHPLSHLPNLPSPFTPGLPSPNPVFPHSPMLGAGMSPMWGATGGGGGPLTPGVGTSFPFPAPPGFLYDSNNNNNSNSGNSSSLFSSTSLANIAALSNLAAAANTPSFLNNNNNNNNRFFADINNTQQQQQQQQRTSNLFPNNNNNNAITSSSGGNTNTGNYLGPHSTKAGGGANLMLPPLTTRPPPFSSLNNNNNSANKNINNYRSAQEMIMAEQQQQHQQQQQYNRQQQSYYPHLQQLKQQLQQNNNNNQGFSNLEQQMQQLHGNNNNQQQHHHDQQQQYHEQQHQQQQQQQQQRQFEASGQSPGQEDIHSNSGGSCHSGVSSPGFTSPNDSSPRDSSPDMVVVGHIQSPPTVGRRTHHHPHHHQPPKPATRLNHLQQQHRVTGGIPGDEDVTGSPTLTAPAHHPNPHHPQQQPPHDTSLTGDNQRSRDLSSLLSEFSDWRAPGCEKGLQQAMQKLSISDYEAKQILANKAMREPVGGTVRKPTSDWSGYGFSKSSPSYQMRQQFQQAGLLKKTVDRTSAAPPNNWPTDDANNNCWSSRGDATVAAAGAGGALTHHEGERPTMGLPQRQPRRNVAGADRNKDGGEAVAGVAGRRGVMDEGEEIVWGAGAAPHNTGEGGGEKNNIKWATAPPATSAGTGEDATADEDPATPKWNSSVSNAGVADENKWSSSNDGCVEETTKWSSNGSASPGSASASRTSGGGSAVDSGLAASITSSNQASLSLSDPESSDGLTNSGSSSACSYSSSGSAAVPSNEVCPLLPRLSASSYNECVGATRQLRDQDFGCLDPSAPMDLPTLLVNLNLALYIDVFNSQEVDLAMFLSLNDSELKELGIVTFGHRKRLLIAIKKLTSSIPEYNSRGGAAAKGSNVTAAQSRAAEDGTDNTKTVSWNC